MDKSDDLITPQELWDFFVRFLTPAGGILTEEDIAALKEVKLEAENGQI